jgi:hypothetical protein
LSIYISCSSPDKLEHIGQPIPKYGSFQCETFKELC